MNDASSKAPKFYGFYELDSAGIILYSQLEGDDKPDSTNKSIVGLNFFKEVLSCQNGADLRRRFKSFVTGKITTDSFVFNCKTAERTAPARVLLARVFGNSVPGSDPLFYIDIKAK